MLKIETTRDSVVLDAIMHHPDVWAGAKDDSTPEDISLQLAADDENNVFLIIRNDADIVGFMAFFYLGQSTYEMHSNFTKRCRGKMALDAGWMAVAWVFRNLPAEKIVTYAFSTAKPALLMMRVAGWEMAGTQPYENLVNGQKVDKVWFKLERSDWEKIIK